MSKQVDGPAFPCNYKHVGEGGYVFYEPHPGMTLRDYFAGQALTGMIILYDGKYSKCEFEAKETHAKWHASAAYRIADAMLAERNK